jgi:pantoate--beta-alanine ligase
LKIFTTKSALATYLSTFKSTDKKIGFVATMGALHQGHLSLIKQSKQQTDLTVCSIFVNPTQFNDPADLEKYPRPIEQDKLLLESAACDVLFLPSVDEMYTKGESWHIDLGELDRVWEGARRPGHYQGVTQIVKKLFDIVKPDVAFFGQKDFQQCMVIQRMVEQLNMPILLKIGETLREPDGLAMSSRNVRLSTLGHHHALVLSKVLFMVKQEFKQGFPVKELKNKALEILNKAEGIKLEYFAICDRATLSEVEAVQPPNSRLVAIIAAWVEDVRLIDNVLL